MAENKEVMTPDAEEADLGIVTLVDEDGNESQFEIIGQHEENGQLYVALLPADTDIESDEWEYVVVKYVEDGDEAGFESIDDDAEFDRIADIFDDMFSEIDYDN